jgi:hypothetical protein
MHGVENVSVPMFHVETTEPISIERDAGGPH